MLSIEEKKAKRAAYDKQWVQDNKAKRAAYQKQYKLDNRERIRERDKKYKLDNREKILKKERQRYHENKEKEQKRCRQYARNNKKKRAQYYKQYSQDNKAKKSARQAKRRALKRKAILPSSCLKAIQLFYEERNQISNILGIQMHVDHKRPLSKGGAHHQDNLQVITWCENLSKGSSWDGVSGKGIDD